MSLITRLLVTAVVSLLLTSTTHGGMVISMYGDADGFGFGAPQDVDGALWVDDFGGVFFTDYREADDLAMWPLTDIWDSIDTIGGPWVHDYTLPFTPTSATLRLYIAGFADVGDVDLVSEGEVVTTFSFPDQFQTTHVLDVDVPLSLIDGSTSFQFAGPGGDGYIMDYARLTIIPGPGALALLAVAGATRRRRHT